MRIVTIPTSMSNQNEYPMKKMMLLSLLLLLPFMVKSQETALLVPPENYLTVPSLLQGDKTEYPIGKFSLAIHPLGFVQFGPIVAAEIGIKDNIALNLHVRFTSLGLLSYVINYDADGLDELSGMAYGGGITYFTGERRSKPYLGLLFEYEKINLLYASGEAWEWKETDKNIIFIFNGGYRFRFEGGLFLNLGAFLGAASTKWDWDYTDPGYSGGDQPGSGNSITPFGMLEVAIGIEF
jgi:hypothetical protein